MPTDDWITVREAAARVNRSERTVYAWIDAGRLAVVRDERDRIHVLRKAVERIVQEMRPGWTKGKPML